MSVQQWSKTAINNQTADPGINWQEGQAPSSVNDSARAMMAALASYRDDIAGKMTTSGTSTAYTLSTNQGIGSTFYDGMQVAFRVNVTNGTPVTLAVDATSAKPLRYAPGFELPANFLTVGTVYAATYFSATGEWLLAGVFAPVTATIASVQTGMLSDYLGTAAPSGYVMASGNTIGDASSGGTERANADTSALYSLLWNAISTLTVSGGRGASAAADFAAHKALSLPDFRGKVAVGKDDMGGSAAGLITNFSGTTLGATGGEQNHTLSTGEMPVHNHTITDPGHSHNLLLTGGGSNTSVSAPSTGLSNWSAGLIQNNTTGITINNAGSGSSHNNIQPSIIVNKIIKL